MYKNSYPSILTRLCLVQFTGTDSEMTPRKKCVRTEMSRDHLRNVCPHNNSCTLLLVLNIGCWYVNTTNSQPINNTHICIQCLLLRIYITLTLRACFRWSFRLHIVSKFEICNLQAWNIHRLLQNKITIDMHRVDIYHNFVGDRAI